MLGCTCVKERARSFEASTGKCMLNAGTALRQLTGSKASEAVAILSFRMESRNFEALLPTTSALPLSVTRPAFSAWSMRSQSNSQRGLHSTLRFASLESSAAFAALRSQVHPHSSGKSEP